MDIGLEVNKLAVNLGMPFDEPQLSSAGIQKVGFFMGLATRAYKKPGDTVYWVKNPIIFCFGGTVCAYPNTEGDPFASTEMERAMALDMICGTSVFFYFNAGQLRMVVAQVLKSYGQSQGFIQDFRAAASQKLGEPICDAVINVPVLPGIPGNPVNQFHRIAGWEEQNQVLKSQLAPSGETAYLFWSLL